MEPHAADGDGQQGAGGMQQVWQEPTDRERLLPQVNRVGALAEPFQPSTAGAGHGTAEEIRQPAGHKQEGADRDHEDFHFEAEQRQHQCGGANESAQPQHEAHERRGNFLEPVPFILAAETQHHRPDSHFGVELVELPAADSGCAMPMASRLASRNPYHQSRFGPSRPPSQKISGAAR